MANNSQPYGTQPNPNQIQQQKPHSTSRYVPAINESTVPTASRLHTKRWLTSGKQTGTGKRDTSSVNQQCNPPSGKITKEKAQTIRFQNTDMRVDSAGIPTGVY